MRRIASPPQLLKARRAPAPRVRGQGRTNLSIDLEFNDVVNTLQRFGGRAVDELEPAIVAPATLIATAKNMIDLPTQRTIRHLARTPTCAASSLGTARFRIRKLQSFPASGRMSRQAISKRWVEYSLTGTS